MATITITTGQGSATQTISTGARGPQGLPGSDASVNSYVDDIATLPDYPTSFPTTPVFDTRLVIDTPVPPPSCDPYPNIALSLP